MDVNEVVIDISEHGTALDNLKKKVQCNYCGKIVSGIHRLKCHLGGIGTDVIHCKQVPSNVKEAFATMILKKKKGYLSKEVGQLHHANLSLKRNCSPSTHSVAKENNNVGNSEQKRVKKTQPNKSIKSAGTPTKESSSLEVQKCIGRFFYETGINFKVAEAPSFRIMVDVIRNSRDGGECSRLLPNYQQLRESILKDEVKETQRYVNEVKSSWKNTGCSILLDGWTDGDGNNLINIIVDCPKGPIYLRSMDISSAFVNVDSLVEMLDQTIEDVGVEHVIQIVTYCTSTCMEKVGKQLMEKYKSLFWVVGASHCLELMLERMGELDLVRGVMEKARTISRFLYRWSPLLKLMRNFTKSYNLVRPSKFIPATPFLTLENILSEKENLKEMFSSSEWGSSIWASSAEGKRVADMVLNDDSFWNWVTMVVDATIPIVEVMILIYQGDKPLLGLIYEKIDQAKEMIRKQVKRKTRYMPFWEIIDDVWDNKLHSPIHAAAYFLNPCFFYSTDFCADAEIASGLLCYIVRFTKAKDAQDSVSGQVDKYREAKGSFREGKSRLKKYSPEIWWYKYGVDCPALQRLAIRVLSQTCDGASKYQLRRDLAEELLTKKGRGRRNPIEEERLKDLAFVHYNLQLRNFDPRVSMAGTEEIDPTSDWIVDDNENVGADDSLVRSNSWMELNDTSNRDEMTTTTTVAAATTEKKKNVMEGCSSAFSKADSF